MAPSIVGACGTSVPQLEIGSIRPDAAPRPVRQRWHDHDDRLIATGGESGGRWWMHWPGLATFWFGDGGTVVAQPTGRYASSAIRDTFARGVMPVVLLARGFEALHASAVLHDDRVVGFCGTSGTGKSTLALALAARGLPHFADDTIVYDPAPEPPLARALPSKPRVDAEAREAVNTSAGTAELKVRSTDAAPIYRIYELVRNPALAPAAPQFVELSPAQRFERLLAHSHPFDMGPDERRRAFFRNCMSLAGQVGMWQCRFCPALDALPVLAAAVERHASSG